MGVFIIVYYASERIGRIVDCAYTVIFNKLLMFITAIFMMIKTLLFFFFNTVNVLNYETLIDFYF